jgi:hypothetical protein
MRKTMPPFSRTISTWMWLVTLAVAVWLGLAAGALAQSAPSLHENAIFNSSEGAKDHGGPMASVPPRGKGHDQARGPRPRSAARSTLPGPSAPFLTEAQISSIKSGLKLMPHQEKYWPAVEAALRRLAVRKTREGATILDSDSVQKLFAAAAELVESLDATQLGEAQRLARLVGLAN